MSEYCAFCRHRSDVACCPWCAKGLRAWIVPLASNLAIVGALCKAHWLGVKSREHRNCWPDEDGNECKWEWLPGCGRSAP